MKEKSKETHVHFTIDTNLKKSIEGMLEDEGYPSFNHFLKFVAIQFYKGNVLIRTGGQRKLSVTASYAKELDRIASDPGETENQEISDNVDDVMKGLLN